jgi:hypothetical protein
MTSVDILAELSLRGDMAGVERELRGGSPLPGFAGWQGERSWSRITRFTRAGESTVHGTGPDGLTRVVLSGMHRLGLPVTVVISGQSGEPAIWLGFESSWSRDWARLMWAPQLLLTAEDSGPGDPALGTRIGVRFSRAPRAGAGAGLSQAAGAPAMSLFERLAAVPGAGWQVELACTPIPETELHHAQLRLLEVRDTVAGQVTTTRVQDESTHSQMTHPHAERIAQWIALIGDDLTAMCGHGGWHVWVRVSGAVPAIALTAAAAVECVGPNVADVREQGSWFAEASAEVDGPSLLGSDHLAGWLRGPAASRGTVSVGAPMPAGRASPPVRRPVSLGTWSGTDQPAVVDLDDLEGHAFVTGTTGSGKSNTLTRLLLAASNGFSVPFLVIDPVKDDYQELAGLLGAGLTVVRGADLRMNVLDPWPGFDRATHVGLVATAFKGAFSMPSPVPYVVTLLFDALADGRLGERPTLHDLRRDVGPLIESLGYRGELEGNIRASLGTRLAVLCAPHRAERLCADDSPAWLMDRPVVVSLADVGDDEERAFLMAALTLYVAEAAKVRGSRKEVSHLTVIEEAHRLVGQPATAGTSEEHGDAAGHAARLVTQLLAEIRSTGESVLIVDQSPAAVARDVVRNTNTKILHRVLDPSDRELCGGAVGLDAADSAFLAQLGRGQAAVFTSRMTSPQMVDVPLVPRPLSPRLPLVVPGAQPRECCGVDRTVHHRSEMLAADAAQLVHVAVAAAAVGSQPDPHLLDAELARLASRQPGAAAACLRAIGIRAVVQDWRRLGGLRSEAHPSEVERRLVATLTPGSAGPRADDLQLAPAPHSRPFRGCAACAYPCRLRPLAQGHPDRTAIRNTVARAADSAAAADRWRHRLTESLEDQLGTRPATDAARCVILHAVGDEVDWSTVR